jgi:hypothetical protein
MFHADAPLRLAETVRFELTGQGFALTSGLANRRNRPLYHVSKLLHQLAEVVGFEPTRPVKIFRFSRPTH